MNSVRREVSDLEKRSGIAGHFCACPQVEGGSGLRIILADGPLDDTATCPQCGRERPIMRLNVTRETWDFV